CISRSRRCATIRQSNTYSTREPFAALARLTARAERIGIESSNRPTLMNDNDDNDEHLPDAIVERLRARERNVAFLTPRVDAALEHAAAEHFARRAASGRTRARMHARWAL